MDGVRVERKRRRVAAAKIRVIFIFTRVIDASEYWGIRAPVKFS